MKFVPGCRKLIFLGCLALCLVSLAACARLEESASDQSSAAPERTVVGQVLLPGGFARSGVEVWVTVTEDGGEPRGAWLPFAEEGRFTHTFRGNLIGLQVTVGIGAEVHRIAAEDLAHGDRAARLDLGVIDLRDRLKRHRLRLRAAEGAPAGVVRVAMCLGPPPVGPSGEPVSLGSRQFPPMELGSEMERLLPPEAEAIYFVVERPADAGRARNWRSGHQRVFGPFTIATMPAELIMD